MNLPDQFRRIAEASARLSLKKPPVVIALALIVTVVGALGALKLEPDTGIDSITGTKSDTYKATQTWGKNFGGDPIFVVAKGSLPKMVLGSDLGVLLGIEGCLSGNIPRTARSTAPQLCRQMAEFKPAVAVYGPGTFANSAANSINAASKDIIKRAQKAGREAGEAAAELAKKQGKSVEEQEKARDAAEELGRLQLLAYVLQLGNEYGLSSTSSARIDNPEFIAQLVFDTTTASKPKSRWAYLFPNEKSALIQVRLRPDLSQAQRAEAVDLVKRITADPKYQLRNGQYIVTGAPVVLTEVQDSIERAFAVLLIAALIVMVITLLIVFPAELRLLPLALALIAAAATYGLLALTGSSIGVGAVAVLPVLVGLAVDYAIQFHARADRAMREGEDPPKAALTAATGGGPPVLAAALATMASLLALLISPVPLIRGFSLLLVAGVALAIVVVLTVGFAVLGWAGGASKTPSQRRPAQTVARHLRVRKLFDRATRKPAKTVAIVGGIAIVGWVAGLLSPVQADIEQLVPSNLGAVKDARELRDLTGTSGQVDVLVRGKNVATPEVVTWMRDFQQKALEQAGYGGENPSCDKADLCPALSLTDIFRNAELTKEQIKTTLDGVGDFSRAVVTPGRRMATIAFGLRQESLNDQKATIDNMRDLLEGEFKPPAGVTADVVGLSALAADASGALSNPWRRLLIAVTALTLLLLVVLAVTRNLRTALAPAITVAIAAGISALLLFVVRVPLNPMSAALGVFIIAIAGEFTLLIHMQYLRERAQSAAKSVTESFVDAYRRIGPAVFASGATAIAGFVALAFSDISMLRGFAVVAVVDLAVALLATVVLLPAVTTWLESRKAKTPEEPES